MESEENDQKTQRDTVDHPYQGRGGVGRGGLWRPLLEFGHGLGSPGAPVVRRLLSTQTTPVGSRFHDTTSRPRPFTSGLSLPAVHQVPDSLLNSPDPLAVEVVFLRREQHSRVKERMEKGSS